MAARERDDGRRTTDDREAGCGRLWLFWAQGYENHSDVRSGVWAIMTSQSSRYDPPWSVPVRICDGIMMNKPTALSSGEWLLPVARWRQDGSAQVYASTDHGNTWSLRGQATVPREEDRNCDEHIIIELRVGRLWMWVRTTYGIGCSVSYDRGITASLGAQSRRRQSRTQRPGFSCDASSQDTCCWSRMGRFTSVRGGLA